MPSKMFSNVWSNNSNINFISICDTFFLTLHMQIMILKVLRQLRTRVFKVKILVLSAVMICGILSLKSKAKGNGADMCSKVIWKTDVFRSLLLPQWDKIIFTNGRTQRQITRNTTSLPNLPCLGIVNAGQFRLQRQLFKMKHSGNVIQGSHYFSKAQVTFKFWRISLDT